MTPCPSCGADRGHLLGCEHNTISIAPPVAAVESAVPDGELDTTRPRALGVPIALAVAAFIGLSDLGQMLLRLLFGMWLHELGHASASWICGVFAVPLPWITLGGESRSAAMIVVFFGLLGLAAWRRLAPLWLLAIPAGVLLVGILIPLKHATTFIVFMGDGGSLVYGTLLMLGAMLLPDESRLSKGALRWGYLVIGAGAFMDAFLTWFRSWRDVAELPFGRSESSAYLGLSLLCLAVLAAAAVRSLTREKR